MEICLIGDPWVPTCLIGDPLETDMLTRIIGDPTETDILDQVCPMRWVVLQ